MKTRVASIVTLLTLLALGFLLVYSCIGIADAQNAVIRDELNMVCRSYSATLEGKTSESRTDALKVFEGNGDGIVAGLFDTDGSVLYDTINSDLPLAEEDRSAVIEGIDDVYIRENAEGRKAYYAIYRFEDGDFLLFSKTMLTGFEAMAKNHLFLPLAGIAVLLIAYAAAMIIVIVRKNRLIDSVMHTLDEFADGKFEARIDPDSGSKADVDTCNAVIGRIQNRVFRQASRNQALNVVMNQMQNGILAVDENLNVILVTPVAKKLLGIVGMPEGKPIGEASRDVKLDDVFKESMQQGGVYTNEVAARTAAGRGHRPLRLYVSPMRNEGKVVGALAMVEDITEIRRLEQVRTDFAANVSHELKTPLTSIRGFVETLEAGAIDNPPMAHKFLKIIMMETERLTRLINDILSISKLESGNDEVTTERLRLDKMAYDVADMLSIHASEKEVTIDCRMNEEPIYVIGNADRVEQMLINLIENAIKYNKPGGSVMVQVFSNGVEANVAISDTGIGIAEENLPRLFERFYRVDKGRSRQMGGTGLGLAIVKHIVRSMSGEIEVHSKLGEGTEFLITLPLAPADDPKKETIFGDE